MSHQGSMSPTACNQAVITVRALVHILHCVTFCQKIYQTVA